LRNIPISRQTYIQRATVIRNRLVKTYESKIDAVIRQYLNTVAAKVQSHGIHSAQGMVHGDVILNGLQTVIKDLYRDAVKQAIGKNVISSRELKSVPNAFGYIMIPDGMKAFPAWLQLVYAFLDRYLLNKVVLPISQTTIAQVDKMLSKALDEGWGTAEMVNELKETELPAWRARLIARTETVRATNIAQMIQAAQSPYKMQKRWIAVDDNRTRATHNHATGVDGEVRTLTEKFSNGLQFPGDPTAPAAEVCNCRCTLGYFAERDEDGNLVPRDPKQELDLSKLLNANGI
jgi:hypothetical protein